jgi:hypothetical protein
MALVKVRRLEREELPMIKPTLHHVTIKTSHLDDMIKWYRLVVGAKRAAWAAARPSKSASSFSNIVPPCSPNVARRFTLASS